jgi:hypothetical protein
MRLERCSAPRATHGRENNFAQKLVSLLRKKAIEEMSVSALFPWTAAHVTVVA